MTIISPLNHPIFPARNIKLWLESSQFVSILQPHLTRPSRDIFEVNIPQQFGLWTQFICVRITTLLMTLNETSIDSCHNNLQFRKMPDNQDANDPLHYWLLVWDQPQVFLDLTCDLRWQPNDSWCWQVHPVEHSLSINVQPEVLQRLDTGIWTRETIQNPSWVLVLTYGSKNAWTSLNPPTWIKVGENWILWFSWKITLILW